jgi:hypothetical protein
MKPNMSHNPYSSTNPSLLLNHATSPIRIVSYHHIGVGASKSNVHRAVHPICHRVATDSAFEMVLVTRPRMRGRIEPSLFFGAEVPLSVRLETHDNGFGPSGEPLSFLHGDDSHVVAERGEPRNLAEEGEW